MTAKVLILSGYGLNCERETAYCCEKVGFQQVDIVHTSHWLKGEIHLKDYQFLICIGGFLDGDDLGAGRMGANRFRYGGEAEDSLQEQLSQFIDSGYLMLGICNGFQLMVKLGVLPATQQAIGHQELSLTHNRQGRFEDRWVHLKVDTNSPCVFTKSIEQIYLPVRHGEGRIESPSESFLEDLLKQGQLPLRYATPEGEVTEEYPDNPNGSPLGIASISNTKGNVMGLMPHPEAFNHKTNHPQWTRHPELPEDGEGLLFFKNAHQHLK